MISSCRSDACASGRKPCPCPQACFIPERDAILESLQYWAPLIVSLLALGVLML